MAEKSEDILADTALGFLGEPVIDDEYVRYGPLRLTVAPKVTRTHQDPQRRI